MANREFGSSSYPLEDDIFIDSNTPQEDAGVPPVASEVCSKKRERGRKSDCWAYFELKQLEVGGKLLQRAECKLCKSHYAFNPNGGTGTLKRHMAVCVPKHQATNVQQSQIQVGSSSVSTFTYNQKRMRDGLALYIASAEQPFTFSEDPRLERWVQNYLQPGFSKISRTTIRNDIIRIFCEKRDFLIAEFACHTGAVSLTSDMWTGVNNYGYICVTAHFIDSTKWTLTKKILAFRMLEYPHNGHHIYQAINEVLNEYKIQDKTFSITFDNHSANTYAIELFNRSFTPPYEGHIMHVRCACHIINLIVQDGLKLINNIPHLNFVSKIRDVILYISSSPSRFQLYRTFCRANGVRARKLMLDVPTRWNSTFLMLKSCIGYEKILVEFSAHNGLDNIDHTDFRNAFAYMQFLEVFFTATNALSGVYYPTSSIALNHLYNMCEAFNECRGLLIYQHVCEKMEAKFRKYWEAIPPLFYLASVMDPRKKLSGTVQLIEGISVVLGLELNVDQHKILDHLTRLYTTYHTIHGPAVESTQPSQPQPRYKDASWKLLAKGKQQIGSSAQNQKTELTTYLETEYISFLTYEELENFDILTWWRTHGRTLPVLSIMARDLLTPPMSTVASESCFSAGGRILSERRSRLKPDILDALICLKDWDDAENRRQDEVDDITEEFNNLETTED